MESLRVDFVGVWPRSGSGSHLLALVRYADGHSSLRFGKGAATASASITAAGASASISGRR
jgi:hypothetical protein